MNRIFLCLLLLSLPGLVSAQKSFILSYQPKNGFVSLNAGPSLPLGAFASQSANTVGAGLAGRGLTGQIAVGYRVLGPVGLMVRAERAQFAMQTAPLNNLILDDDPTYTQQATAGNWQTVSVLAGPYISIPMGRFSVDVRLLAGRMRATCPRVTVTGQINPDETLSTDTPSATATATVLSTGFSVRYRLGRVLAVQANADYSQANVPFLAMTTVWQQSFGTQTIQFDNHQQINTVSISAGLTFLFGNRARVF